MAVVAQKAQDLSGMSGLCLSVGLVVASLGGGAMTLAWTHSIEKIDWEEDWRLDETNRLEALEARIHGSGAGMEPPEGAVLDDGVWRWKPDLPRQERILLARSPFAGEWRICLDGRCRLLSSYLPSAGLALGEPYQIKACERIW
jgi:hypothetical protein